MRKEAILLVPGLFGFGAIGPVRYFDRVAALLSSSAGIPETDVFALDTPPTGPFWRRVNRVHEKVRELRQRFETIHLVGHSTGGVDIRLFANDAYLWPGGPFGAERSEPFGSIGRIVSISAPHKGTPIATRLRGAMENAIPFLFLVSILAKADEKGVFKEALRPLTSAFASMKIDLLPRSRVETALRISGMGKETAKQADEFLSSIVEDHCLVHELTPRAMAAVNEQIRGGRQLPVSNFVTVSPPPWPSVVRLSPGSPWFLTPFQRTMYTFSYENALPEPAAFPFGPFINGVEPPSLSRFEQIAEDGVVPCASQSMNDTAEAVVYGDHLDVVGHYQGEHGGETVFDSGASFDDARMKGLWDAVGKLIRSKVRPYAAAG